MGPWEVAEALHAQAEAHAMEETRLKERAYSQVAAQNHAHIIAVQNGIDRFQGTEGDCRRNGIRFRESQDRWTSNLQEHAGHLLNM